MKSQDKIYSIVNECKTVNSLSICKQNSILDISNNTCLPNILKSRPSKCNHTNDQHIPTVNEISEGLVLLNQFDGNLQIGNETQKLNGTYLLKFSNTTIVANDHVFVSKEKSTVQVLPAVLQPTPEESGFKETLSLQMMKEIHINNTNHIGLLQTEKNIQSITTGGLLSIIIIMGLIFIIIRRKANNKIRILNATNIAEPVIPDYQDKTENLNHGANQNENFKTQCTVPNVLTAELDMSKRRKFYETSFF